MMWKKRFYQGGVLFAAAVAAASVSGCGNAAKDVPASEHGAEPALDGNQGSAKDGQAPDGKSCGTQKASESVKLYQFGFCGYCRTHPYPPGPSGFPLADPSV